MQTRMFAVALAAIALGAGSATSAHAATTLVVDQAAGPYTSIGAALQDAQDGDTIAIHAGRYAEALDIQQDGLTLKGEPGTTIVSDAPFVVTFHGFGDRLQDLTVQGEHGGLRVAYDGDLLHATVLAADEAVALRDYAGVQLDRSFVRASAPAGRAITAYSATANPWGTSVKAFTSVIAGGPQGVGIDLATGASDDLGAQGAASVLLSRVTLAGAATAVGRTVAGHGGPITVKAYNSILHGAGAADITGVDQAQGGDGNERTAPDAATFANPAAGDFHLRADAAARAGAVTSADAGTIRPFRDLEGTDFAVGPTAGSIGAYQFVDHAPVARAMGPGFAAAGAPATLDASASSDPDPGGAIAAYTWTFDDGTPPQTTTAATVQHVFAALGRHTFTVRVRDITGSESGSSAPALVVVNDRTAPTVTIAAPGEKAKLRRHKTKHHRTLINVLKFSGAASDTGAGLRAVQVTLVRTRPVPTGRAKGKCLWLDGARRRTTVRSCRNPAFANATLRNGRWSWHTPANLALPAGSWTLSVRAVDAAGNVSPPSVLHFTAL